MFLINKYIQTMNKIIFAFCLTLALGYLPGQLHAQVASNSYKIMPLGDSITDGYYEVPGGYRIELWNKALSNDWKIEFVGSLSNGPDSLGSRQHEGYIGYTIAQISALVDKEIATYNPQMILLHIGTNDVLQSYELNHAPSRLQSLIERIFRDSPSVQLLVATITPLASTTQNADVKTYNAAIPKIVSYEQSLGHHITLVDEYSALTPSDLNDGIHPSLKGYNKMGDVWATAIQPLLPQQYSSSRSSKKQQVIAYDGGSFTKNSQNFPIGQYRANKGQLNVVGNDLIESLRVPQGLTAYVCVNEPEFTYAQACKLYPAGDYSDLGYLDNQISYIEVKQAQ
jgi:lysophospholipase L1-like esterase